MSGPDAQYAAYLQAGSLHIQQCDGCGRFVFYPRVLCPHCGGGDLTWRPASGKGTVYATTVIRRRPEQGPAYNLCLVDLEEGVRLTSRVEGVAPEDVVVGMRVKARVTEQDGGPIVVFDPA